MAVFCSALTLFGCNSEESDDPMTTIQPAPVAPPTPSEILRRTISAKQGGLGVSAFIMPASDNFDNIPQKPSK